MLSLTATGYVSGKPEIQNSDYGDSITIGIRCKGEGGKNVFYVNAKFYGKKMAVIEKYINDGDQVTVTGLVSMATEKTKKNDGTKYAQIYMTGAGFTIPPNPINDTPAPLRPLPASEEEEEEIPF